MWRRSVVCPCEVCSKDPLCSECMRVIECSDNVWEVYERLVEDWRRYDAMLWQLPFGTMSAVGVILTLALHYIPSSEHVVRAILFTALAWFTLTMMHLSYKVRHFQIERAACIEAIECKCAKFTIPYDTKGAKKLVLRKEIKRLESWFYEVRSYHLAYIMYIGIIAMLLYLAYIESPCIAIVAIVLFIIFIIIYIIISWRRRGDKDGEVKHNRS